MKLLSVVQTILVALALAPVVLPAQYVPEETVNGSLLVEEDLLVRGRVEINKVFLGENVFPGYSIDARWNGEGSDTSIDQFAYGTIVYWNWVHRSENDARIAMQLDGTGRLSLYDVPGSGSPVIVFDPIGADPQITIAGQRVITQTGTGHIENLSIGYNSSAEGACSTAVGNQAATEGYNAVSVGTWSLSAGNSAVSVGSGTIANGIYASALGSGSTAIGNNSTAVGRAVAMGEHSLALGNGTTAMGFYSSAIGSFSQSSGNNSVALGHGANAADESSLAMGQDSHAEGDYAIALGTWARTEALYSLALGMGTYTTQPYQIALGSHNQPTDNASFMIGNGWDWANRSNLFVIMKDGKGVFRHTSFIEPTSQASFPSQGVALQVDGASELKGQVHIAHNAVVDGATTLKGKLILSPDGAEGTQAIVLNTDDETPRITIAGKRVLTEGDNNSSGGNALFGGIVPPNTGHIALGLNATTANGPSGTAYYSIAIGNGTLSSGWGAVSLGDAAIASEQNATALGERAKAFGKNSTAIGATAKAEGGNSLAMGLAASAGGSSSLAMGIYAIASGQNAMALGGTSNATGNQSIALGAYSIASGQEAIAIGRGASAPELRQIVLGAFNQDEADAQFIVGGGTDFNQRSNLFTIKKDGRGVFRNTSYVEPTTEVPRPTQPEALTVEGSMTVKGDLKLSRRQGDIGMGVFGRAEDQSPAQ
ncbi:MAG: hypothetical protein LBV12_01480 [Puniceicoccales bacterium]|jgi:hypothetical protein|nr:hypothetical protein [Puniceicoccales bacterium]